jgi:hypothetical protein
VNKRLFFSSSNACNSSNSLLLHSSNGASLHLPLALRLIMWDPEKWKVCICRVFADIALGIIN